MIGIYVIRNKRNGKIYLGQSRDLLRRWKLHQSKLRLNKHHSIHLQNAWNQSSEDFVFQILEQCPEGQLSELEEFYMKLFQSFDRESGYNINIAIKDTYKRSEETKIKISMGNRGKKRTAEQCANLSKSLTGIRHSLLARIKASNRSRGERNNRFGKPCPEHVKIATSTANSKTHLILNPSGEVVQMLGVKPFCRHNGLCARLIFRVLKGEVPHHKGWRKYEMPIAVSSTV